MLCDPRVQSVQAGEVREVDPSKSLELSVMCTWVKEY